MNKRSNYYILIIFIFVFTAMGNMLFGQSCPNSNVLISSNQDLINFRNNYPTCDSFQHDLIIDEAFDDEILNLGDLFNVINGSIEIENNQNIKEVKLGNRLSYIKGEFYLRYNLNLESINFENSLDSIGESFVLINSPQLQKIIGAPRLQSIGHQIYFNELDELSEITVFEEVDRVDYRVYFSKVHQITNLDFLRSLVKVKQITIFENDLIENILGLTELDWMNMEDLTLVRNPELKYCLSYPICQYLVNEIGAHDVSTNFLNGECMNVKFMQDDCQLVSTTESLNPRIKWTIDNDRLHILNWDGKYSSFHLFNSVGGIVQKGKLNSFGLDLASQSHGIYFLRLIDNNGKASILKFLK